MDGFLAESWAQLPAFDCSNLATVAWGLALLHHRPQQGWLERFLAACAAKAGCFTAPQLAKLLWALATLDCRPQVWWLSQVVGAAVGKGQQFGAEGLAEMLWALDKLDATPGKSLLRGFSHDVRRQLAQEGRRAAGSRAAAGMAALQQLVQPAGA
jgi:hypothetical protein